MVRLVEGAVGVEDNIEMARGSNIRGFYEIFWK
jgi:hypothetical protein